MNKYFILTVFILSSFLVESQNWDSIRGGVLNGQIEKIFLDSVHNELIVSSKFLTKVGGLSVRGVARWNGIKWDSLAGGVNTHDKVANPNAPSGNVLCGIPYNGKLLVGGYFNSIGGVNATSLALWDGIKWDSLPKRAFDFNSTAPSVTGLYKKGNLVYVYGTFTVIAGQSAKGIAIWDGTTFTPIPLAFNSFISINSVVEYQNQLFLSGGNFYNPPYYFNNADVLKYDGTNWVSMITGGLKGFASGVSDMTVYNNNLYVGGHFLKSDGNTGDNIMKWDGTQWQDVGFGSSSTFQLIKKLVVHNNKLWAFGCYDKAAQMPAFCVSVYDGVKWCTLNDTLDNCLSSAAIFKDSIYVGGGFWSAGGDLNIKYLAKLKNESFTKSCNGVGITESESMIGKVKTYPNPTANNLHIESENNDFENSEIEIINILGQTALKLTYSNTIDVSSLSQGFYNLKIISKEGTFNNSKFVKE